MNSLLDIIDHDVAVAQTVAGCALVVLIALVLAVRHLEKRP